MLCVGSVGPGLSRCSRRRRRPSPRLAMKFSRGRRWDKGKNTREIEREGVFCARQLLAGGSAKLVTRGWRDEEEKRRTSGIY